MRFESSDGSRGGISRSSREALTEKINFGPWRLSWLCAAGREPHWLRHWSLRRQGAGSPERGAARGSTRGLSRAEGYRPTEQRCRGPRRKIRGSLRCGPGARHRDSGDSRAGTERFGRLLRGRPAGGRRRGSGGKHRVVPALSRTHRRRVGEEPRAGHRVLSAVRRGRRLALLRASPAGRALGIEIQGIPVQGPSDLDGFFAAARRSCSGRIR